MKPTQILVSLGALAVIAASLVFIYRTQIAPPPINTALHTGLGERLASETARVLGGRGRIVLVALESGASPVADTHLRAFLERLRTVPAIEVVDLDYVEHEEGGKYGPGTGMSARRLTRLVEKHAGVDAIVSLIGFPEMDEKEVRALGAKPPRLVGFSRATRKLGGLLTAGIARAVIVPRFQFPAPGTQDPTTPAEWFDLHFQVMGADAPSPVSE